MRTGYVSDDLMVIHHTPETNTSEKVTNFRGTWSSDNYTVFYCKKGNATVRNGALKIEVKSNQLVIIDSHNAFGYQFDSEDDYECVYFQISPIHFLNIKDDKNFLRAFEFIPPSESLIKCTGENQIFRHLFDSLIECDTLHLGITHVLPRIFSIISHLAIYFDKKYPNSVITTDSIPTQIINYINRNYLSTITYETIIDKFFVSKPVINSIMHNYTGLTLREYIEHLRLKDAKVMLETKNAKTTAKLCGYKTYSTFFRAYKRYYGTPPTSESDKPKTKWPLTHN